MVIRYIFPLLFFFVYGCSSGPHDGATILSGQVGDLAYSIQYVDHPGRDLSSSVDSLLDLLDHSFSEEDPSSALSRFNNAPVSDTTINDPHLVEMVRLAAYIWLKTNGAFNPASNEQVEAVPSDGRRTVRGMQMIRIVGSGAGSKVTKLQEGTRFQAAPLLPGYYADQFASQLETKGISNYLVEVGDVARVRGVGKDGKPMAPRTAIPAVDVATVLSNIGPGGKAFAMVAHTGEPPIDPRTGVQTEDAAAQVCVMHDRAAVACGIASALMNMGAERSRTWLQQGSMQAMMSASTGSVPMAWWATPNWPGRADAKGYAKVQAPAPNDAARIEEKLSGAGITTNSVDLPDDVRKTLGGGAFSTDATKPADRGQVSSGVLMKTRRELPDEGMKKQLTKEQTVKGGNASLTKTQRRDSLEKAKKSGSVELHTTPR